MCGFIRELKEVLKHQHTGWLADRAENTQVLVQATPAGKQAQS